MWTWGTRTRRALGIACFVVTGSAALHASIPTSVRIDTSHAVLENAVAIGADGFPIIAYRQIVDGDLVVTHCDRWDCSVSTTVRVDTVNSVGGWPDIAIGRDGLAVISHYDATRGDLRVTHCDTLDCRFSTSTSVDTRENVGLYTSIAIGKDGFPLISHYNFSKGDLRVTHCANAACTTARSSSVDTTNNVGLYTSIAFGPGDPLATISHYDRTNARVRLSRCRDSACTSADSMAFGAARVDYYTGTSLAIDPNGLPLVSYVINGGSTGFQLIVSRCGNWTCTVVSNKNIAALNSDYAHALTIGADGLPVVGFSAIVPGRIVPRLTYFAVLAAHCGDWACSTHSTAEAWQGQTALSIAIGVDGSPVFSHLRQISGGPGDPGPKELRFTKCNSLTCA